MNRLLRLATAVLLAALGLHAWSRPPAVAAQEVRYTYRLVKVDTIGDDYWLDSDMRQYRCAHCGEPTGSFGARVKRDFGSVDAWRSDLKATGMAGRGWAWTAYDWDEGRLFNYIGDAQNTFPVWNATPLVALDVYEHAYFLDYQTDRASYIEAFFDNLDWDVVNGWVDQYGIPSS